MHHLIFSPCSTTFMHNIFSYHPLLSLSYSVALFVGDSTLLKVNFSSLNSNNNLPSIISVRTSLSTQLAVLALSLINTLPSAALTIKPVPFGSFVLYYTILYYTILYYTILYYTTKICIAPSRQRIRSAVGG